MLYALLTDTGASRETKWLIMLLIMQEEEKEEIKIIFSVVYELDAGEFILR